MTEQASSVLRSVAAFGLNAAHADEWPTDPLDDADWGVVVHRSTSERLVGVLAGAVDGARLPTTEQQRSALREAHAEELLACLWLEQHLLEVTSILAAAGIEPRVLKGPAVAHLDHDDPAQRTFGDIDLLVRSSDVDRALETLSADGWQRRYREVRPGFDRRFGKGVCMVSPTGLEADIHRTLVLGPYGLWIRLDDLWASATPFELGGERLFALSADLRLLHACYHAALGDRAPRWSQLRDVAVMVVGPRASADVDQVRSLAHAWRGEAVVARAVTLTWETLGLADHPLAAWARAHQRRRVDDRALATYLDPSLGSAARSMMAVRAVPGWRSKAAYVRGLALPSSTYGAGRHRSHRRRWRAAVGELWRLVGRRA